MRLARGPGPVFVYEAITATRRIGPYLLRSAFVAALLIGLLAVWDGHRRALPPANGWRSLGELAQLSRDFFSVLSGVQISLVLLAGPALTAGAVCLDRARGTLAHMLVTDLTDTEIVLGKLCPRLLSVFAVIACAIPVVAICALLGGISFEALTGLTVVSVSCATLGCSLALAFSVRSTKTNEVLMAVYAILAVWLLAYPALDHWFGPMPPWFENLQPYHLAEAPYARPGTVTPVDWLVFAGVYLGLSLGLVAYSVRTLKREVEPPRPRLDRLQDALERLVKRAARPLAPSLDADPVYWREWHRGRPSRLGRRLWYLFFTTAAALGIASVYSTIQHDFGVRQLPEALIISLMFDVSAGLLMVAVTAPTSLTEERTRGSLDVLMSTPLTTRSIVVGKWRGAFRHVPWLAAFASLQIALFVYLCPERGSGPVRMMPGWFTYPLTFQDRFYALTLPAAQILAAGALFSSLGVFVGVVVAKPGRAIAWNVSAYFVVTAGWLVFAAVVLEWLMSGGDLSGGGWAGLAFRQGMFAGSPYTGPVLAIDTLARAWPLPRSVFWRTYGVTVATTAVLAGGLLALSVAIFDRRLGRVPADVSANPYGPGLVRRRVKPERPAPKPARAAG